ncbi:hypothetical protein H4R23_005455, partial [Coemansia sp. Cherry 401B]
TITGRLSQLMLKRWSMLAEVCHEEGCSAPMMRDPESGQSKCVWHDGQELFPEEFSKEEAVDKNSEIPEAEDEKLDKARPNIVDEKAAEMRRRKREQGDAASERIGKRLLQGWAMVDRTCPGEMCFGVPLVQDREKMQECVICGQQYMDEDAYTAKYGKSAHDVSPTVSVDEKAVVQAPVATEPALSAARPLPVVPKDQPSSTLSTAISALNAKLEHLTAKLVAASNLDDIQRISSAMAACAAAIAECSRAGRN